MAPILSLRGQCACGRNDYAISIPENSTSTVDVVFDDTAQHRRAHASPLPVFLRVPLPWIASSTYAYFPDETPLDIRKVFTPHHEPTTKRHFCGFCGSPLSYWHERSREDAEWIYVSLGSLDGESLDVLGEAGILGRDEGEEQPANDNDEVEIEASSTAAVAVPGSTSTSVAEKDEAREVRGQPWFEEMLEGSELGRLRRRKGGRTSRDGNSRVEWEIVEYGSNDAEGTPEVGIGTVKRKLGDMVEEDDLPLRANQ